MHCDSQYDVCKCTALTSVTIPDSVTSIGIVSSPRLRTLTPSPFALTRLLPSVRCTCAVTRRMPLAELLTDLEHLRTAASVLPHGE